MKFILPFLTSFLLLSATAQTPHQEINQQIWKTFIKSYNSFDTELFMSLYSKDIIRIPRDDKKIFSFAEYKKNINRENQFNKNYNIKASLEVRFTERVHTATTAYETGIYKIDLVENTGKKATVYSSFMVILRKENGSWKIFVDADSAEGESIKEKDFLAAKAME